VYNVHTVHGVKIDAVKGYLVTFITVILSLADSRLSPTVIVYQAIATNCH
jgi:hypothetical protein